MNTPIKPYWRLLVQYLKPSWPSVVLLAVLLFGNIGLQLVNPQVMRRFIDTALAGGALETLVRAGLSFIGVALAQQVVSVLATYLSERLGWSATNALRADLARHCLHLDMSFHNVHTPGEMIERIDGDVTVLSNFFSRFAIQIVGNALLIVGVMAMLCPLRNSAQHLARDTDGSSLSISSGRASSQLSKVAISPLCRIGRQCLMINSLARCISPEPSA